MMLHTKYNFLIMRICFYVFLCAVLLGFYFSSPRLVVYIGGPSLILLMLATSCPCCKESLWAYYSLHPIEGYMFNFKLIFFMSVECPKCGFKSSRKE